MLKFRGYFSYVWMLVMLTFIGLVFLRPGFSNAHVYGLVFLRLGLVMVTFRG